MKPYLVQRCTVNTKVDYKKSFFKNFDIGYTENSKPENALNSALLNLDKITNITLNDIKNNNEESLRVIHFGNFDDEYLKCLNILRNNEYGNYQEGIFLKECCYFKSNSDGITKSNDYKKTDLWFDIENNVFFTYNKNIIKKLPNILKFGSSP